MGDCVWQDIKHLFENLKVIVKLNATEDLLIKNNIASYQREDKVKFQFNKTAEKNEYV